MPKKQEEQEQQSEWISGDPLATVLTKASEYIKSSRPYYDNMQVHLTTDKNSTKLAEIPKLLRATQGPFTLLFICDASVTSTIIIEQPVTLTLANVLIRALRQNNYCHELYLMKSCSEKFSKIIPFGKEYSQETTFLTLLEAYHVTRINSTITQIGYEHAPEWDSVLKPVYNAINENLKKNSEHELWERYQGIRKQNFPQELHSYLSVFFTNLDIVDPIVLSYLFYDLKDPAPRRWMHEEAAMALDHGEFDVFFGIIARNPKYLHSKLKAGKTLGEFTQSYLTSLLKIIDAKYYYEITSGMDKSLAAKKFLEEVSLLIDAASLSSAQQSKYYSHCINGKTAQTVGFSNSSIEHLKKLAGTMQVSVTTLVSTQNLFLLSASNKQLTTIQKQQLLMPLTKYIEVMKDCFDYLSAIHWHIQLQQVNNYDDMQSQLESYKKMSDPITRLKVPKAQCVTLSTIMDEISEQLDNLQKESVLETSLSP